MIDLAWTAAVWGTEPVAAPDHLDRLVSRVAAGDRSAFRSLYAFLAVRVWRVAARALPHPAHALAVTRSTFLEVWHTAGAAARFDARDWIYAITAFRVDERRRLVGEHDCRPPVPGTRRWREPAADFGDEDDRTSRELTTVLGAGRATVRVSPAMFMRIEDLDRAVDAIAAATCRRPRQVGSQDWLPAAR
jgi:RNA polymerase sigma-70 factor (ECF subfamily)